MFDKLRKRRGPPEKRRGPSRRPTSQALSDLQERMYHYIQHCGTQGYAPTIRELTDRCGSSSTSVTHYNLQRLEIKGYIKLVPNQARGIRLPDGEFVTIPRAEYDQLEALAGVV